MHRTLAPLSHRPGDSVGRKRRYEDKSSTRKGRKRESARARTALGSGGGRLDLSTPMTGSIPSRRGGFTCLTDFAKKSNENCDTAGDGAYELLLS